MLGSHFPLYIKKKTNSVFTQVATYRAKNVSSSSGPLRMAPEVRQSSDTPMLKWSVSAIKQPCLQPGTQIVLLPIDTLVLCDKCIHDTPIWIELSFKLGVRPPVDCYASH